MLRFHTRTLVAIFASAVFLSAAAAPADQNVDTQDIDHSIKPGDDFYRYANGGWLKTVAIPAGQSSYDTRAILTKRTSERVRNLIQDAAAAKSAKGSLQQKVGEYYASFVDVDAIEAKGLTPLGDEMSTIAAIKDKPSLSAYLGTTLNTEVDGLTANGDHVFGVWVNQSFTDSEHYVFHLLQGGLGMPDRDAYLDPSPKMAEVRTQYQSHIAAILKLANVPGADAKAARILALEVRMAQSHAPDSDAADVFKQNNLWKRSEFSVKAPGIDWDAYFSAAGVAAQPEFIVWQPSAVTGTSALVGSESVDVWKDYLRFHLIAHYASVLPKAVAAILSDTPAADRGNDAIAATNAALGQAVGQLYTQKYFPPEAKTKARAMVADLITAYRARIANLTWMSSQTKEKALGKLSALKMGIGYPDTWIDYSTLDVVRGEAVAPGWHTKSATASTNSETSTMRRAVSACGGLRMM
jgi:predicted metalloendopeptidase